MGPASPKVRVSQSALDRAVHQRPDQLVGGVLEREQICSALPVLATARERFLWACTRARWRVQNVAVGADPGGDARGSSARSQLRSRFIFPTTLTSAHY